MARKTSQTIHATCVALPARRLGWAGIGASGVLLTGPSASGKSDLALRLIDRGGWLIADDQVVLTEARGKLIASPPQKLRGLIEMRGVGIVPVRSLRRAKVSLAIDLKPGAHIERLPDPVGHFQHGAASVPVIELDPFHASAPAKIEAALAAVRQLAGRSDERVPAMQGATP